MRRTTLRLAISAALVLPFAFTLTGSGFTADKAPNGKDLYKQNCRVCHEKGSKNGEFTPMSLIQDQWKAFFKDKLVPMHKDVSVPSQTTKLLEALTPEQVKAIEKFCVDHAADSEQPQTCS